METATWIAALLDLAAGALLARAYWRIRIRVKFQRRRLFKGPAIEAIGPNRYIIWRKDENTWRMSRADSGYCN